MMTKELYVIGDYKRFVVQNMIRMLQDLEFEVTVVDPIAQKVNLIPNQPLHVILCLSDELDTDVYGILHKKQIRCGLHVYVVGKIVALSIDDEDALKKLSAPHFPTWPLDIVEFMKAVERNCHEKRRILVVDDEVVFLRAMQKWLGPLYEVVPIDSAKVALSYLRGNSVDLVVLDYEMPEMNGPNMLRRMRMDDSLKDIPVMFLTAKDDKESVMDAIDCKPCGYLLKTQSPDEIRAGIMNFFSKNNS